jgi:hypothetical protein
LEDYKYIADFMGEPICINKMPEEWLENKQWWSNVVLAEGSV